ncbi:hypothetical protein Mapa_007931 [Marchantia paleacea]|nr:hypothetical protein Mapa_007931 [Marchantia paleacea]
MYWMLLTRRIHLLFQKTEKAPIVVTVGDLFSFTSTLSEDRPRRGGLVFPRATSSVESTNDRKNRRVREKQLMLPVLSLSGTDGSA